MSVRKGAQEELFHFKVVLLGSSSVGKTSISTRFVNGQFFEAQLATLGALFVTKTVTVDGEQVKIEIWDTAGSERFAALTPMYYRGAQAAIVTYDITDRKTFDRVKEWVKELHQNTTEDIVIAIAGNKADLGSRGEGRRVISFEEGKAYADSQNAIFMETSAKTEMNINEIFLALARKVPRVKKSPSGGKQLTAGKPAAKKGGCSLL